jgi:hypothetical protein
MTSNAGDHFSSVLNSLRERALDNPPKSFGFYEYSAPQYCKLDDKVAWAQANPAQALGTGLQGYQALNQPAPQLNLPVAPTAPITQRPAPSFGLGQDEKLLTRLSPSYGGLQVYRGY